MPPDLIRSIETQFESKVAPANGYGLTETTSAVIANSGADYFAHPDSVGRPAVGTDVRVVDELGQDLPAARSASCGCAARTSSTATGTSRRRRRPRSPTAGSTPATSAAQDEDGFVYVVDRLKDVVIRGGENIYSAEVEAVLFEHPAVLDVAIVGLPHEHYGEEVAAVVNLREGATVTVQELQEFAADQAGPLQGAVAGVPARRAAAAHGDRQGAQARPAATS